ncbi:MAG: SufE family protein, partial [Bacteroidales bacterium]|nr:SufE family protein [Bacteroidales bacterium]
MDVEERIHQLTERFAALEDWTDRYALLIEMGKSLPLLPDEEKTEKLLIKGCQSRGWIKAELKDGKVFFKADSDAVIT